MSPLIYALLAFVSIAALGFAFVPGLLGGNRADKRIKALQGDIQANRRESNAERQREYRQRGFDAPAAPRQRDVTGLIGNHRGTKRHRADQEKKQNDPDHRNYLSRRC